METCANKKVKVSRNPYEKVVLLIKNKYDDEFLNVLLNEIPKKYEKIGNLVLFPENSFSSDVWRDHTREISLIYRAERIAIKSVISNDDFRTPNVRFLHPTEGNDPWVVQKELGLTIHYNIEKSMFCKGNISEKERLSKFDCSNEVVVDLFAGIGYFTLVYLVHSKAKFVHACEWNPAAVEALEKNLKANKVQDRCKIYVGDNRTNSPKNIGNRINLGILPSSESFIETACECLNHETGGVLHVHENISLFSDPDAATKYSIKLKDRMGDTLRKLTHKNWNIFLQHIHKVKSYGPHIDHVVIDIECRPL